METIFHGYSKLSGVYKIVNKVNNRIYIGSAKEFNSRYKGHLSSLNNNIHSNKYLQNDFNKCGTDAFVFETIEVVTGSKGDRQNKEQQYIDCYYDNQDQCYNFKRFAIVLEDKCFSSNPEETKKKISKASKERWASKTPEERKMSEETKEKLSVALNEFYSNPDYVSPVAKQHTILNKKTNETIIVNNLSKWCRENKINRGDLRRTYTGELKNKINRYGKLNRNRVLTVLGYKLIDVR